MMNGYLIENCWVVGNKILLAYQWQNINNENLILFTSLSFLNGAKSCVM